MELLITKAKIETKLNIQLRLPEANILKFMQNAQDTDLRVMLGDDFYFNMIKKRAEAPFVELLAGSKFVPNTSTMIEYEHEGIEGVLADLVWARFIIHGSFHVTDFGFVEKSNQDSKPVSTFHRGDIKTQSEQNASSKFQIVKRFIEFKEIDYWNSCSSNGTTKHRIRKV